MGGVISPGLNGKLLCSKETRFSLTEETDGETSARRAQGEDRQD